jgi:hypothetical protein
MEEDSLGLLEAALEDSHFGLDNVASLRILFLFSKVHNMLQVLSLGVVT